MTNWFRDGIAIDAIAPDDRSWQFGDGLFETIAIREGQPRLLDWHLERCLVGCRRLGIDEPGVAMSHSVRRALEGADADTEFATLKLVVTAGGSPRGYQRHGDASRCYTAVFPSVPIAESHYRSGVRVRLCNTRLARQPQLAGLKTLNRLEQVLARQEWSGADVFEGLTRDTAGHVICGTMSNVFIVEDKALVTPDLSAAGIAGIMRRKVIETAHDGNIEVSVADLDLTRLKRADEVFLSNSQFGVVPVRELADRTLVPGAVTREIMQALKTNGIGEIAC